MLLTTELFNSQDVSLTSGRWDNKPDLTHIECPDLLRGHVEEQLSR